ncbi:hypothetical protein PLICRDRAFT_171552 [Plicaturopsis crispa FD-325 SS-3]|nr:hypothetical protein PLICRDRAFT_171552 [Plicaturopsis crispa FD-325 SS-3]
MASFLSLQNVLKRRTSVCRVADIVFRVCTPADVYTVRLLNKTFKTLVDYYVSTTWSLEQFVQPWFLSLPFRHILRKCDAYVSGSQVVQFFGRTTYPGSDLDIYVPAGSEYELARFVENFGYKFDPRRGDQASFLDTIYATTTNEDPERVLRGRYDSPDIVSVYYFVDHSNAREVQLIVTRHANPLWMVMRHHSSAVMNFLTWDRAVSLFPMSTFVDQVSYIARRPIKGADGAYHPWVDKWSSRGFAVVGNECSALTRAIPHGRRHVYDRYSWVIPWDPQDMAPQRVPGIVEDNISFDVLAHTCGTILDSNKGAAIRISRPFYFEKNGMLPPPPILDDKPSSGPVNSDAPE